VRDNGVGVHGGYSNEFARWSVSHDGSEEIHSGLLMVEVYDGGQGWSGKEWHEDAAVTGEALEGVFHVVLGT